MDTVANHDRCTRSYYKDDVIADPLDGPSQILQVGAWRDVPLHLDDREGILTKNIKWPHNVTLCVATRSQMYRDNSSAKNPHVLLVRASALLVGRKDGCNIEN